MQKMPAWSWRGSAPLPLLHPAAAPLAHTHTPVVGQRPGGSQGKGVKPQTGAVTDHGGMKPLHLASPESLSYHCRGGTLFPPTISKPSKS